LGTHIVAAEMASRAKTTGRSDDEKAVRARESGAVSSPRSFDVWPAPVRPVVALRMQRLVGNQAVQQWLQNGRSKQIGDGDERAKTTLMASPVSSVSQPEVVAVEHQVSPDAQPPITAYDGEREKASTSVKGGAAASRALGAGMYGLTFEESVAVTIDATLDKVANTWSPKLETIVGHFSQQVGLLPGQDEITGPSGNTTKANHCDQAENLAALGNVVGNTWYMKKAVKDHEDVHAAHFGPGLKNAAPAITTAIEAASVANGPKMKKAQAIALLKADATFLAEVANAKTLWVAEDDVLLAGDHAAGGPCDKAEHKIVDPMLKKICQHAKKQKWPACASCP
jgi:hypothetical protein